MYPQGSQNVQARSRRVMAEEIQCEEDSNGHCQLEKTNSPLECPERSKVLLPS